MYHMSNLCFTEFNRYKVILATLLLSLLLVPNKFLLLKITFIWTAPSILFFLVILCLVFLFLIHRSVATERIVTERDCRIKSLADSEKLIFSFCTFLSSICKTKNSEVRNVALVNFINCLEIGDLKTLRDSFTNRFILESVVPELRNICNSEINRIRLELSDKLKNEPKESTKNLRGDVTCIINEYTENLEKLEFFRYSLK
jgi:hypothetical protein